VLNWLTLTWPGFLRLARAVIAVSSVILNFVHLKWSDVIERPFYGEFKAEGKLNLRTATKLI
jgi:hypothetical protein